MNAYLDMDAGRRRTMITATATNRGVSESAIEKDFWVCWILNLLFHLPSAGQYLTFKGGTSLAKGWNLIERFSEDVDIVIDKHILGFGGENAPEKAASIKQQKKRLKELKEKSRRWISEVLEPELRKAIAAAMPNGYDWILEADADDHEGQTLLFHFPAVDPVRPTYFRMAVKIELGARGDIIPSVAIGIAPFIGEEFPDIFTEASFTVRAVAPVRTFWEKVMLLHEETFRPTDKPRRERMARHYYDVYKLIQAGIGESAVEDMNLFQQVVKHRSIYFRQSWVNYSLHKQGSIQLVPPEMHKAEWEKDYKSMGEMFFGSFPDFDEILNELTLFQDRFNRGKSAPNK